MKNDMFKNTLSLLDTATDSAVGTLKGAVGLPKDRDVEFYEKMSPEDFESVRTNLGMERLESFIRDMEQRRMRDGN